MNSDHPEPEKQKMEPEFYEPESDELLLISEMQKELEEVQVWEEDEDPEGFWGVK